MDGWMDGFHFVGKDFASSFIKLVKLTPYINRKHKNEPRVKTLYKCKRKRLVSSLCELDEEIAAFNYKEINEENLFYQSERPMRHIPDFTKCNSCYITIEK